MPANALTIPESVLLLALADESGERRGNYLTYALAGAALTELVLKSRLAEAEKPAKTLAIVSTSPVRDPYIDACLDIVIAKGTDKVARVYIETIASKLSRPHELFERLVARGILSEAKSKVLFFTRTTYPEANPAPERMLKERLSKAIKGTGTVDERDAAIIALASHSDLLPHNFDRELLKTHKARIKAISEGGLLPPNATKAAIAGVQAAVMIATLVPVMVAASS
jgi:Golgi phosphoprotein 3 GPP34